MWITAVNSPTAAAKSPARASSRPRSKYAFESLMRNSLRYPIPGGKSEQKDYLQGYADSKPYYTPEPAGGQQHPGHQEQREEIQHIAHGAVEQIERVIAQQDQEKRGPEARLPEG